MKRVTYILLLLTLSSACQKERILLNQPREEDRTIGTYLTNNHEYTLYVHALNRVGLLDSLVNGKGPYTVLALRNRHLNQEGIFSYSDIDAIDIEQLHRTLSYHILPVHLELNDIPIDQFGIEYPTLSDDVLWSHKCRVRIGSIAQVGAEMIAFSGSQVINKVTEYGAVSANQGDFKFVNGVMHNIDKLIKRNTHLSIREFLEQRSDYSIFVAALKHFSLWDDLEDSKIFTVFAPNNRAFESLGIYEETIYNLDVSRFDADLLLGVYLMSDRRFFIRDYDFFLQKDAQFWMMEALRDKRYNRIIMGNAIFTESGYWFHYRHEGFDYTIGITQLVQPYQYAFLDYPFQYFLGGGEDAVSDYICGGRSKFENDYILSNGNVHNLDYMLVHFEEALQ